MVSFEKITENVYLLRIPFSVVWTGVILLTGEKNYLIDSGSEAPEKYLLPALAEMGLAPGDIAYLLNTHCHGDHITGHYDLVTKYGMKTATFAPGAEHLRHPADNAVRIRTKFPAYSPAPQSWLRGVEPDVLLNDGDTLDGRLRVIAAPGHDSDCVCWYDIPTKTIICGDSLQANGTPTQGIGFYQSLPAYRGALDRLLGEDIVNIVCGHDYDGIGSVILGRDRAHEALRYCRFLIDDYDARILAMYREGEHDPAKIAVRLIGEIGCGMPEYLFMPLNTITEHLRAHGLL